MVKSLETERRSELDALNQVEEETKVAKEQLQTQQGELEKLKSKWKNSFHGTLKP
jgi:predicted nuclease with TOPRIM domain